MRHWLGCGCNSVWVTGARPPPRPVGRTTGVRETARPCHPGREPFFLGPRLSPVAWEQRASRVVVEEMRGEHRGRPVGWADAFREDDGYEGCPLAPLPL